MRTKQHDGSLFKSLSHESRQVTSVYVKRQHRLSGAHNVVDVFSPTAWVKVASTFLTRPYTDRFGNLIQRSCLPDDSP